MLLVAWGAAELALLPVEAVRPNPRHAPGVLPDRVDPEGIFVPDPALGWQLRPGLEHRHETDEFSVTYRTDAEGWRIGEPPAADDAGRRIVLLGDSFTFGVGAEYEDTYGARIQRELEDTRVWNLAVPGYGVDQLVLQLEENGLDLEPDLVIVGLCDADLARSLSGYYHGNHLNKPSFRLEDGELVRRTSADRHPWPLRWLDRHSRVWMLFRQVLRRIDYARPTSEWWHLNEALLDRLRATCAEHGVPVVFVYVPTPEWRPFPTLARYMERVGATYVDLVEGAPAEREALHHVEDRHFTAAGHAYAARRILEVLG